MLNSLFGNSKTAPAPAPVSPALPAGYIERESTYTSADSDLVALAVEGWIIKEKIDALQKTLKAITEKLENALGVGAALAVDDTCRVTIAERTTFKLTDPDTAEALLGGRFQDLVTTQIEYTPTDKLKAMVLDPDHPLSAGLRACMTIKSSTTVTFRPGKAL